MFSAHYLGNKFVYVNWIVELCHYQKKYWFFLTEVSLDIKCYLLTHSQTKAESKFTHKLPTACWLSSVFALINMRGIFFSFFQKYFLFRNGTLAFKKFLCKLPLFPLTTYLHSGSKINFLSTCQVATKIFFHLPGRKFWSPAKWSFKRHFFA